MNTPTTSMINAGHDAWPAESMRAGFAEPIGDFFRDQKQIWTSPFRVRPSDATWLLPLGGLTAGLFVTDRQFMESIPRDAGAVRQSNVGLATMVGVGAGLYLFSFPTHKDRWRETGFLAGEAALNSLVTVEALKYPFGRERVYIGSSGRFVQGGVSFPSGHSAIAWSIAGVFAHEYPGRVPALLSYGMASAISVARIRGRQHFPSDVLVGGVLGYLIAQSVYTRRHDVEIGGRSWHSPREFLHDPITHKSLSMGSPYVPLDSWIYAGLERLTALGYIETSSLGLRPWTRQECLRLVGEAAAGMVGSDSPAEIQQLYDALSREFAYDSDLMSGDRNVGAHVESVYSRVLGISGKPLTDNQHFGQTMMNDFGRPYEQGRNSIAGASAWTSAGPFVVYARGEYQSAPSAPSLSSAALNFIGSADRLPPDPPSMPIATIRRFRLLEGYVGMNVANWQFSFGRRNFWWGPSEGGTMLVSDNAAPLANMFTIDRVTPIRLPSFLARIGEIRVQAFIGQLSAQEFVAAKFTGKTVGPTIGTYGQSLRPQPFLSGEKISFKITRNFELNLSKTTIYGGPGNPLTFSTFLKSSLGQHVNGDVLGDGRTAVDFAYRIPKLRDWLTLYGEGLSEDEISPIGQPQKSVWQAGIYLAKVPHANKFDLRVEGGSTVPVNGTFCTSCFYANGQYLSGYTNDGQLIGTWIGRAAQGELLRTNYWLGARKKVGVELRHRKVDRQYLPQGGTQNDVAVNADIFTAAGFRFSGNLQYERWQIPLLSTGRQSNVLASFEFGFWPTAHTH